MRNLNLDGEKSPKKIREKKRKRYLHSFPSSFIGAFVTWNWVLFSYKKDKKKGGIHLPLPLSLSFSLFLSLSTFL